MFEDHTCEDCVLARSLPATVCMVGRGNPDTARLVIYLDHPSYMDDIRGKPFITDAGDLLRHFIARMGIDQQFVYMDYVLKCFAPKKMIPSQKADRLICIQACSKYRFATLQTMPNLKSIVAMGRMSLEAFTGNSEMKNFEGCAWEPREFQIRDLGIQKIWIAYSPNYAFEKPAETPDLYRVIWCAAEEAGLNPTETKVPPFKWPNL